MNLFKKQDSEEVKRLKLIRRSIIDSLDGRLYEKEDLKEDRWREDTKYIADLLDQLDHIDQKIREQKESEKLIHFHLPKINGQVVAAGISAAASVYCCKMSRDFGDKCLQYDSDGNVVPTRLFNLGPKMKVPNP